MESNKLRRPRRALSVLLCGALWFGTLTATVAATAQGQERRLRERVIELEDERDALKEKYEAIAAEYKTVKGEIRASIDIQRRLDDALAVAAELQERSGDASGLARGLEKCEFARENTLVDLMLTESSLNEMIRKYRDLERQMHKDDCSAIKEDLVQYRDQAEHCMTDVDGLKRSNAELSKRASKQATRLAELEEAEGELIKARAELEVVAGRNAQLKGDSDRLKELDREHVALKSQLSSATSSLEASKNELAATKAALNGLLDSLDSRLQFEALKDAHEKEILPFWLDSLVMRVVRHAEALYVRHVQPVFLAGVESVDGVRAYFAEQIDSLTRDTSSVMQAVLHPMAIKADVVFGKDVPMRRQLDRVVRLCSRRLASLNSQRRHLHALVGKFQQASVRFISSKVSVVVSKISYFDHPSNRARVNVDAVAVGLFYAMVAMCTVPLVVIAVNWVLNGLMYYFRTGTALTVVPDESDTIDMIEESIGYKFRNRDYAVQALEKSPSLHQVGLAIINLILANEIKGTDSRKEVEQRSQRSCVDRIVRPGPGRKSVNVAKEQKTYMYICLLAAVFRDSDESVEKVMRVWGDSTEVLEATNDKCIPTIDDDDDDDDGLPDIVHSGRSSSSSVSVGEVDPRPLNLEGSLSRGEDDGGDEKDVGGGGGDAVDGSGDREEEGEKEKGDDVDVVDVVDVVEVKEESGDVAESTPKAADNAATVTNGTQGKRGKGKKHKR